ncbi:hypothetical protein F5J12DRAFT_806217 [Pisolithus orientalis]|uniref:uncharacterized protein n=1 Tax=Pisolithus orientalis TaxID=936130 RepID=UPI0022257782|nr:uncharacterized protein F5J12DRAFT_806217 [Pisolithus orientalis]KAI6028563.1 hypothetical protein F5J12DRAFT_806217 [Pisolithus orientalis]
MVRPPFCRLLVCGLCMPLMVSVICSIHPSDWCRTCPRKQQLLVESGAILKFLPPVCTGCREPVKSPCQSLS